MPRSRLHVEWALIVLLASLVVLGAVQLGLTRPLDNAMLDLSMRTVAPMPSEDILVVEIDDESLARNGRWPWPRSLHAELIRRISAADPVVIACDLLFVDPAPGDAALAEAMRGRRVLLPALTNGDDVLPPVPELADAASGIGSVVLNAGEDGLIRSARLEAGGYPHLMELAYRAAKGHGSSQFARGDGWIPFRPAGSFRTISARAVLAGELAPEFVRDHIVIVGATASGLGDRHPVAGASRHAMSGVEIEANLINAMMADRFITPLSAWTVVLLSLAPLWLLMACFLRLGPGASLRVALLFLLAWALLAFASPPVAAIWLPPGPAILGMLIAYPLWGWRRLEMLNAFVVEELELLRRDPELMVAELPRATGDRVDREARELHAQLQQLIQLRRFLKEAIAAIPDAICVLDADGFVRLSNAAAARLFGPGLTGRRFDEALGQMTSPVEGEDAIQARDGRYLMVNRARFSGHQGQAGGWLVRLADITALRAAVRDREQVLQFLSHDMRAPQSAIIAALDSQAAFDSALADRIRRYAYQTLHLADDFVQLARAKVQQWSPEPLDLASALDEAVDLVWPQSHRKNIRIVVDGEPESLILGDYALVTRMFTNLLDNAVKFSPEDTGIRASVRRAGDVVRCEILDAGPGLPPERRARMFDIFGTRHDGHGGGLGLAFVKVVAERHGARIEWSSANDAGTRFVLSFPAIDEI